MTPEEYLEEHLHIENGTLIYLSTKTCDAMVLGNRWAGVLLPACYILSKNSLPKHLSKGC